jgi:hypothetical protein
VTKGGPGGREVQIAEGKGQGQQLGSRKPWRCRDGGEGVGGDQGPAGQWQQE